MASLDQKKIWSVGTAVGVIALAAVFAYAYRNPPMTQHIQISQVSIGDTIVKVEVADTDAKRDLGLSYRDVLVPGNGMLFIFDKPQVVNFWMKDMNFAIDILYANASGTILTINRNVQPETYLENPPRLFNSYQPVLYVLEVPAGFATEHDIVLGSQIVVQ